MKYRIIITLALMGILLVGCKKHEQEILTPKIANEKVEVTATTATFTWTVDWSGKLISVVEVSENEDMCDSQSYGSETETDNPNFTVTVMDLKAHTKYYYRYWVWNHFYEDNKFEMEKKDFCLGCVDLGLPSGTLWATCNIGASSPEEYGDYFAWGETTTKTTYEWSNYKYCNGDKNKLTKYCSNSSYGNNGFIDNLTSLLLDDDAATANWGNDWCMPTKAQWDELERNTTNSWVVQNGVGGWRFTANNCNNLFLPAAGGYYEMNVISAGWRGTYWPRNDDYVNYCVNCLSFNSDYGHLHGQYTDRCMGHPVRPVRSASQK